MSDVSYQLKDLKSVLDEVLVTLQTQTRKQADNEILLRLINSKIEVHGERLLKIEKEVKSLAQKSDDKYEICLANLESSMKKEIRQNINKNRTSNSESSTSMKAEILKAILTSRDEVKSLVASEIQRLESVCEKCSCDVNNAEKGISELSEDIKAVENIVNDLDTEVRAVENSTFSHLIQTVKESIPVLGKMNNVLQKMSSDASNRSGLSMGMTTERSSDKSSWSPEKITENAKWSDEKSTENKKWPSDEKNTENARRPHEKSSDSEIWPHERSSENKKWPSDEKNIENARRPHEKSSESESWPDKKNSESERSQYNNSTQKANRSDENNFDNAGWSSERNIENANWKSSENIKLGQKFDDLSKIVQQNQDIVKNIDEILEDYKECVRDELLDRRRIFDQLICESQITREFIRKTRRIRDSYTCDFFVSDFSSRKNQDSQLWFIDQVDSHVMGSVKFIDEDNSMEIWFKNGRYPRVLGLESKEGPSFRVEVLTVKKGKIRNLVGRKDNVDFDENKISPHSNGWEWSYGMIIETVPIETIEMENWMDENDRVLLRYRISFE